MTRDGTGGRPSGAPGVIITLGTAAVYLGAAKLGLTMAFTAEQVTVVWPASGIALAAAVLLGRRRAWLGIALGAFCANVTTHEPLATALGIAAGNTLEAVGGAWLLERVRARPSLDRLGDALALVGLVATFSTMVAATIGVASLCLGGVHPWGESAALWWVWWVGDTLGILVVAPLLLVWGVARPALPSERRAEGVALVATTLAVGAGVFGRPAGPLAGYPLHYAVFPLVIWAALRLGQRGTVTVTFVTAAMAISGTVRGVWPFTAEPVEENLFMLQLFMSVVAVTGLVLGAAISERDGARRRAAREYRRLELGEQRLRLALDAGQMRVWDWNIATGAVKWTDNLEAVHGLTAGTFPGTIDGFRSIVHPDDRARVDEAIARAIDEGTGYEVEFRNLRSDGTVGWICGIGRVLPDAAGRPARMIGVGLNVTERRRLTEELAARVQELADADRRKDEFLGMLSHELRNPLTPLRTALELLRMGVSTPERTLSIAERQVKQLMRLVDDLLDVSRITQGKIALRQETIALDEIVTRAVEVVRPLLDERGHDFAVVLPPERVWLDADPARLTQVLANLLGNAIKYTPAGGSIRFVAEATEERVTIRVRDTGVGIAPDLLPHVFDLFVQGDRALDRERGGLGIGLTIVRRLVELHGGRVTARSDGPGRGSELVVELARRPAIVLEEPPAVVFRTPAETAAAARVLLIEDNEDAADSLSALIGTLGHEVRVAPNGRVALEIVDAWAPNAVVSDIGLPGMDGYQLVRALRDNKTLERTTFIALSGYGREEDRELAFEAGFDHHLAKPPDVDTLADLLERAALASGELTSRALS
jgi:two-component system CheB/CheR fusion protein